MARIVTPRIQLSIFVTLTLAFSGDAIWYFLRGWVLFVVLHFVLVMHLVSCHHLHFICNSSACFSKLASVLVPSFSPLYVLRPTGFSIPSCLTVWPSLYFTQTPRSRPKVVPNPTCSVITVRFGSCPNVYKISLVLCWTPLSYLFSSVGFWSDDPTSFFPIYI